MVGDYIGGPGKPEIRYLGQQFSLMWYRLRKHDIER